MRFTWHEAKRQTTRERRGPDFTDAELVFTGPTFTFKDDRMDYDELDDYPKIAQAELDRAPLRVGLKPAPRKRRVTILLDTGLIEYFKAQAGERGYQTLINETLRQAVEGDQLEEKLRRIIREEMQREVAPSGA